MSNPTKKCGNCDKIKELNRFSKSSHRKDGLQYECKDCNREKKAALTHRKKITPPIFKICIRCKENKKSSKFNRNKRCIDGLNPICSDCVHAIYLVGKAHGSTIKIESKMCVCCNVYKKANEFTKRGFNEDGLHTICKDCARADLLRRKYKLSISDFEKMLSDQDGKCAICKRLQEENPINNKSKKIEPFVVDHCHKTDKIRGLLCNPCNRALGALRDDPVSADNAALYLRNEGFHKKAP